MTRVKQTANFLKPSQKTMSGLFITSSRIGDAVLTLSLIERLRLKNADFRYVVAADPLVKSLFVDDPAVECIISFPKQKASMHWVNLWRKTVGRSWDWIIDTRGSAMTYALRSNKRFVWKKTKNDQRHKIEQLTAMIGEKPTPARIQVSDQRCDQMKRLLPSKPLFVVAPVANWIGKQWPMSDFQTIIQRFCETFSDAHVLVIAAPTEDDQLKSLRQLDSSRITFSTDLAEKHGLTLIDMAALMKHGSLFLGNDSGLMHMASAVELPVIALFGPSPDAIYGPYLGKEADNGPESKGGEPTASPLHTILRIPKSYDALLQTTGFSHKNQVCYMHGIELESVWQAILDKKNF